MHYNFQTEFMRSKLKLNPNFSPSRRNFVAKASATVAATFATPVLLQEAFGALSAPNKKIKLAMVGTGHRGCGMWGDSVIKEYGDLVEFVGLCDINPGRVETAKKRIGANCPTFTDFDKMMRSIKPDFLIVTTVDALHDTFIIRGMELGAHIITEKPMTTDEDKCKLILEAEKKYGKKVIVTFNYRYGTLFTKVKELLASDEIGEVVSVDFNWYLNVYHGADYFRRWHAIKEKSGTLWVHKATHHFDLLNWWLDSDPIEVTAYGALEHYGKNGPFRHTHCRPCPHKDNCKFKMDINSKGREELKQLYADNERFDGYLRDGCVFRNEIDIYDKMSAQIKYANGVIVNYSLTTYSPYEGFRLAFNGKKGRLDTWEGIPYLETTGEGTDQATLHAREMLQNQIDYTTNRVIIWKNFEKPQDIEVKSTKSGHGGGDGRMKDKIFKNTDALDPYKHAAGTRDGALSVLIGVAARKSIELGRAVKISELTDIQLFAKRP